MKNKIIFLTLIALLIVGCESPLEPDHTIDIYSELSIDSNGYYHFDYPDGYAHTYSYVKYNIYPSDLVRVFWDSPDYFEVEYQGQIFYDKIINYSTYSDDDGTGKQMYYIYEDFIGDTLTIYGYVANDVYDVMYVIINN